MFYEFKFGKGEKEIITVPEIIDGIAHYIDGGRRGTMTKKVLLKNFKKVAPKEEA